MLIDDILGLIESHAPILPMNRRAALAKDLVFLFIEHTKKTKQERGGLVGEVALTRTRKR